MGLDADAELTRLVVDAEGRAKPERILRFRLEAFDWNCPQHITPRFTEVEIAPAIRPLQARLAELEAENAALRDRLTSSGATSQAETSP